MKFLSALVLVVACVFVFGDEDKCLDGVKDFFTCAKEHVNETEREAIKETVKTGTEKCFADAGCQKPEPKNSTLPKALLEKLSQIPEPVKKCLKDKLLAVVGDKFNECLSKKGVKNVNLTEIANSLHAQGEENVAEHGKDKLNEIHQMISAKIAVAKSLSACADEKFSGDTAKVKPLEQCIHDNKKSIKPRICADLKPCISNVSADCQKRGQEVHKAICECKKEKEAEIATKLAPLGKQDKVSIKDIIHTVLDDQQIQDIVKQVDACYTENNEQEPEILKLVLAVFTNNSTSTASPSSNSTGPLHFEITGKDIQVATDSLQLAASDASECEACQ